MTDGKTKRKIERAKRTLHQLPLQEPPLAEEGKPRPKLTPEKQEELNKELLQAVIDNDAEKVKTFLKLDGDVNYKIKGDKCIIGITFAKNSTLLIIASGLGHIDIVDELIKYGADVNAREEEGGTALMRAASLGFTGICKLLIEKGADVNILDKRWSWTALMYAVNTEQIGTIRYLLSIGANPLLKDDSGRTAYNLTDNLITRGIIKIYENLWLNEKLDKIYFAFENERFKTSGEFKGFLKSDAKQKLVDVYLLLLPSIRKCKPDEIYGIFERL